jgi:hypothetical protein
LPLLLLGFVALLLGTGGGLLRLGWTMPAPVVESAGLHGPLMVCGFFGVVIALERAVAVGRLWAYAGPLLAGFGTAAAVHGATPATPWLYLAGSAVLLAASLHVLARQREVFTIVIAAAAACWTAGLAWWLLGAGLTDVVPWWLAFLVFTIAGERLELARYMPPSRTGALLFRAIAVAALLALLAWTVALPSAMHAFGLVLLALAAWLARYDIARHTVRQQGLTRYIACCLLSGYAWLALAGALLAANGWAPGSAAHDLALHAVTLGFVFAMVFGHAPIIVPAVLRVAVRWAPRFYAPLALLHASLLLRAAGAMTGSFEWRRISALLSALALAAFVATMLGAVKRQR